MTNLTTFSYAGSKITFATESGVTVNATQMAKTFNKRPNDWVRLDYTKEFLEALSTDTQIPVSALIQTVRGGNGEQGTWMHEDAALEFARWLSPKFAIWCNRRIKELLTSTQQQPVKAEVLPPPIENQTVTSPLVERVDGKLVTTSRKLAQALGRKHDRILETIRSNRHLRAFKYGNFTTRAYSSGASHGYEFLITRKGLDALASVMRYNAKERIAQAYEGAWDGDKKLLPVPASVAAPEACREDVDDTIRELVKWIDELRVDLRKARVTAKTYAEMYSGEKAKRCRSENREAYWHDLYEDLMLRVQCVKDADEVIDAHVAFKKRLLIK